MHASDPLLFLLCCVRLRARRNLRFERLSANQIGALGLIELLLSLGSADAVEDKHHSHCDKDDRQKHIEDHNEPNRLLDSREAMLSRVRANFAAATFTTALTAALAVAVLAGRDTLILAGGLLPAVVFKAAPAAAIGVSGAHEQDLAHGHACGA